MKTLKRILIANIIVMLAIGFNVVPAEAYTTIGGPVSITASGTLTGDVLTFTAVAVDQTGTGPSGQGSTEVTFSSPLSGELTDSNRALKITGGTNYVDARIIIYTDNDNATYKPDVDPATGVDGSGMVGQKEAGYIAPLVWGVKTDADYDPNTNVNYDKLTKANLDAGKYVTYIVDKRHTHSFTDGADLPIDVHPWGSNSGEDWDEADLDANTLYEADGTPHMQTRDAATDDLYPQLWDKDLYDKDPSVNPTTATVVSPALRESIATIAYNVGLGVKADSDYYICYLPDLTTSSPTDQVLARLSEIDRSGTPVDEHLYIYIGADFMGRPAQAYSTDKLYVEMGAEL